MKAKYILEAIEAMEVMENLDNHYASPEQMGAARAKLAIARIHLKVHSGLHAVDVPVDHEEEQ